MRIGLSTAAYYGQMETEEAASKVASFGLPCCEAFLETYSEYSPDFARTLAPRFAGVQVVSIHARTQHFETDFVGQSKRQRSDAYALYGSFLDAGAMLGARVHVFHGPENIRGKTPRFERWQEGIAQAVSMAAERGLSLCWETVSWCHLNAPERVKVFCDLWPEMCFVLDSKQVFELGQNPTDYIDAMGDRLRHVHVLDFDAAGHYVLPGQGVHDFRDIGRALRANGYAGDVILEPYGGMANDEAALRRSIDWLRDTFGAE